MTIPDLRPTGHASHSIWLVTDGKAGDLAQVEGLAMALGGRTQRRDIHPRRPWAWLAPAGGPDPREDPRRAGSRLAPPFPDIVIATGRRAVPVVRAFRGLDPATRPFTIFLKDPRIGAEAADLIWVPEHDRLTGDNVIRTLTAPHRFSAARLLALREAPPRAFFGLPHPLLGIVLGGPSKGTRYSRDEIAAFAAGLREALPKAASVVATPSRRTPPELLAALKAALADKPGFVWDGSGDNPLPGLLALSDALLVTADSHNMVSEALASGARVHVLRPRHLNPRLAFFIDALTREERVRPFTNMLDFAGQEPLDSTPALAEAVNAAYSRFRTQRNRRMQAP
ncbi:hypothetical protein SAMN05216548_101537 [Faunimonas pinastri]|uniref:Nucleoside-diphosphate sugar epimerase n=1 Tax=Faunimonas pinastri TaxID=1855383 RepID=A0A1H9AVZ1_9HYPH|nr:mitochondrial fission ELM1 family protein [Faunimonas pinastri]SEP80661.1 hypothetical protein SAMN05216548_101537 [Faunimonas pinastri]